MHIPCPLARIFSLCITLLSSYQLFAQQTCHGKQPSEPKLFGFVHPAMGTEFSLFLYRCDAADAGAIADDVFEEIDRQEQLLSNYRESSELSRINADAAKQTLTTDPELIDFLQDSLHWSAASDGAFDISVGKLMKAWGFYTHQGRIPPPDEMSSLRAATGWQKIHVDAATRTVRFTDPGVELDPGGIGKGFAVDAAVRILRADGVTSAMLSAGSSTIYALGAPPHKSGWPVIIAGPLPSKAKLSVVMLRDTSLSSSDCSQKNFTAGGHLYCHIMDPRTLRPVEGRLQVSIIHPSATASDALSNVLFVDNPERSFRVLQKYAPEAHALVLSKDAGIVRCALFHWASPVALPNCTSPQASPKDEP
jgi:FAD:protein FMN transferase